MPGMQLYAELKPVHTTHLARNTGFTKRLLFGEEPPLAWGVRALRLPPGGWEAGGKRLHVRPGAGAEGGLTNPNLQAWPDMTQLGKA